MNDTAYKISVMQAYLEGKEIEYFSYDEKWISYYSEPTWNWDKCNYRIKPTKQLNIPWEMIKPEYKWAAMDEDGAVYVYKSAPCIHQGDDYWSGGECMDVSMLIIDIDGVNWKHSTVERPE